jgi:hypothetical protein
MVRVHGRATKVLEETWLGLPLGFRWPWPSATILISDDELCVSLLWRSMTEDARVALGDVGLVCLSRDYRVLSFTSVAVRFHDGSFWRYQLGPPDRVLLELEARGWPVDRSVIVSGSASYRGARIENS